AGDDDVVPDGDVLEEGGPSAAVVGGRVRHVDAVARRVWGGDDVILDQDVRGRLVGRGVPELQAVGMLLPGRHVERDRVAGEDRVVDVAAADAVERHAAER